MEKLEEILLSINIGNREFFKFMIGKIKSLPLEVEEFGWGCFPITDKKDLLYDIRVVVPRIVDEATLLVNIHELAHAYELYGLLGTVYVEHVKESEEYAVSKEDEYLRLVHKTH